MVVLNNNEFNPPQMTLAQIGRCADSTWAPLHSEPDSYRLANQELWLREMRSHERCKISEGGTTAKDIIPNSRLAKFYAPNAEYDLQRESVYKPGDETSSYRHLNNSNNSDLECWQLPEVEAAFKLLTLTDENNNDDLFKTNSDWLIKVPWKQLLAENYPALGQLLRERFCNSDYNIWRAPCRKILSLFTRYSITSIEENELRAKIESNSVRSIWGNNARNCEQMLRFGVNLNANVPEFVPKHFQHAYRFRDDIHNNGNPSPRSDSGLYVQFFDETAERFVDNLCSSPSDECQHWNNNRDCKLNWDAVNTFSNYQQQEVNGDKASKLLNALTKISHDSEIISENNRYFIEDHSITRNPSFSVGDDTFSMLKQTPYSYDYMPRIQQLKISSSLPNISEAGDRTDEIGKRTSDNFHSKCRENWENQFHFGRNFQRNQTFCPEIVNSASQRRSSEFGNDASGAENKYLEQEMNKHKSVEKPIPVYQRPRELYAGSGSTAGGMQGPQVSGQQKRTKQHGVDYNNLILLASCSSYGRSTAQRTTPSRPIATHCIAREFANVDALIDVFRNYSDAGQQSSCNSGGYILPQSRQAPLTGSTALNQQQQQLLQRCAAVSQRAVGSIATMYQQSQGPCQSDQITMFSAPTQNSAPFRCTFVQQAASQQIHYNQTVAPVNEGNNKQKRLYSAVVQCGGASPVTTTEVDEDELAQLAEEQYDVHTNPADEIIEAKFQELERLAMEQYTSSSSGSNESCATLKTSSETKNISAASSNKDQVSSEETTASPRPHHGKQKRNSQNKTAYYESQTSEQWSPRRRQQVRQKNSTTRKKLSPKSVATQRVDIGTVPASEILDTKTESSVK